MRIGGVRHTGPGKIQGSCQWQSESLSHRSACAGDNLPHSQFINKICDLPMACNFSISIWTKYNDVACILMPANVWAGTDWHLALKAMCFYFLSEFQHKGRSTSTTSSISAPMTTYKYVWTCQSFRSSWEPFSIFDKHFFNESFNIKMG